MKVKRMAVESGLLLDIPVRPGEYVIKSPFLEVVAASDYDALKSCYDGLLESGNKLLTERDHLTARLEAAERLLRESRRDHLVVDGDCWYSCPKSGNCCNDGEDKDHCNCGADRWNANVDAYFSDADGGQHG